MSAVLDLESAKRDAATRDTYTQGVILGAILLWPELVAQYGASLTVEDFDGFRHAAVWEAMGAIAQEGAVPDLTMVVGKLRDQYGDEFTVGELVALTDGVPRPSPDIIKQECKRLRRFTLNRTFIRDHEQAVQALLADPAQMGDEFLRERGEEVERLQRAHRGHGTAGLHSFSDSIDSFIRQMSEPARQGVPFGFLPTIDLATCGVQPGELMLLLGRTESLKTMALLNLLRDMVRRASEGAVLLVTCEMPQEAVVERLWRMEVNRTRHQLRDALDRGEVRPETFARRFERVFVLDRGKASLADVEAAVRDVRQRAAPLPLRAVLIDHAGLLTTGKAGSSYERATDIAIGLKQLARQLDTAFFVIVQANRAGKSERDPVSLESARDSGAFEENADFVLGFGAHLRAGTAEAHVIVGLQKNRRGEHVRVPVAFNGHTLTMFEATPEAEGHRGVA